MARGTDQRLLDRFPVSDEGFRGVLSGSPTLEQEAHVIDLSLGGAGLIVDDPDQLRPSQWLQLGLQREEHLLGETRVRPVHMSRIEDRPSDARLVGVRFGGESDDFLQALCHYLVSSSSQTLDRPRFVHDRDTFEKVSSPKRIGRLFTYCRQYNVGLSLFELSGAPLGIAYPCHTDNGALLCGVARLQDGNLRADRHYLMAAQSATTLYLFVSRFLGWSAEYAGFDMPGEVLQGGYRRVNRMPAGDAFPVTLEFIHPQIPGKFIHKQARDVGLGGMSFDLDIAEDVLAKGSVINSAVIRLPHGYSLSCRCVVRHTLFDGSGRYYCGVQFLTFAGNDQKVWVEEVLARMNPEVEQATPFSLADVWEVLDRSGYLEEKPTELMVALKQPFMDVWSRLSSARGGSRCWLFRKQERPFGTVCISQIYSKTWLIHQLACDLDEFEPARRKLTVPAALLPRTAFQWMATIEPDGYIVSYHDADKQFNQWAWFPFFEQYEGKGLVHHHLAVNDFDVDTVTLPATAERIWVRHAGEDDRLAISDDLLRRDGPVVHDAFDYSVERLGLGVAHSVAEGDIIERRRHVVAAGCNDHLLGYALMESAASGVNIFALYDTCRIVVMEGVSDDDRVAARDALFARVVSHYRDLGRRSFLCLTGEGDTAPPEVGEPFAARGVRAVVSSALIPQLVAFVTEIWVHR